MTPIERYALNFAKVCYWKDSLDALDNTDWYHIHRIFNTFNPEYHDLVAKYPTWAVQKKNITPRDLRRVDQCFKSGDWPMFLFSHARIEKYIRQHLRP